MRADMNDDRELIGKLSSQSEPGTSDSSGPSNAVRWGAGKKIGLYGAGLLLLGVIFILLVIFLTGYFAPFQGTEGIGP
jgi:hypothetical protein